MFDLRNTYRPSTRLKDGYKPRTEIPETPHVKQRNKIKVILPLTDDTESEAKCKHEIDDWNRRVDSVEIQWVSNSKFGAPYFCHFG